jgi:indoleamine 2,3-dioxygenase
MPTEKGLSISPNNLITSRGFLPDVDPITSFDRNDLRLLDRISANMPGELAMHSFRPRMDRLKPLDVMSLEGPELDRAWSIYGFAASGYVHEVGAPKVDKLPDGLAVPLFQLAIKQGKPPILAYDGYDLANWKRIDPDKPIEVNNLEIQQSFTRMPDETRFINVHTEIESEAAPALLRLYEGQEAALQGDGDTLENVLETMDDVMTKIRRTQGKMIEGNNPDNYFSNFRPYIMSFEGITYDGVDALGGEPQTYRGETGAQSSIMPAFDSVMGVHHKDTPIVRHSKDMRAYMPVKHREFIAGIESNGDSIHDFVSEARDSGLTEAYNSVLVGMYKFSRQHLDWADQYINQHVENPIGTGGTQYMEWLGQMAEERLETQIQA